MTYAAYGLPMGRNGFIDRTFKVVQEDLALYVIDSESVSLIMMVNSVLPERYPETLEEREYRFKHVENETRKGNSMAFVNSDINFEHMLPEKWAQKQTNMLSIPFYSN